MKVTREGRNLIEEAGAEEIEQLEEKLSFTNPEYVQALKGGVGPWGLSKIDKKVCLLRDSADGLCAPRAFDFSCLDLEHKPSFRNAFVTNPVSFPPRQIDLRKDQDEAVVEFFEKYKGVKHGGYYLKIPTAVGKTILALEIARRLKQKTLVIVPTTLIFDGWFKDAELHMGLGSCEIGGIKGSRFSIGDELTVASIQTLEKRTEEWDSLYEEFGTVIVDEPDQIVNRREAFNYLVDCPSRHLIGFTATDDLGLRRFKLDCLFGKRPILEKAVNEVEGAMQLNEIRIVRTNYVYDFEDDIIDWNKMMPDICCDERRNEIIINNVMQDLLNDETVLINTKWLNHVSILKDMLNEEGVEDIVTITGAVNSSAQKRHAATSAVQSRSCRCVIASTAIKVGANLPNLQNIHFAIPYANSRDIEQLIGRVRRQSKGKDSCAVRYYLDGNNAYLHSLYIKHAKPVFDNHQKQPKQKSAFTLNRKKKR